MEITLADGGRFTFDFPVFVPMRHGGGNRYAPEPFAYPDGTAVPIYTDDDLARRGMESQECGDLTPLKVEDGATFRRVIENFQRCGATHLAIDICTQPGRPGGFLVPIATALG